MHVLVIGASRNIGLLTALRLLSECLELNTPDFGTGTNDVLISQGWNSHTACTLYEGI